MISNSSSRSLGRKLKLIQLCILPGAYAAVKIQRNKPIYRLGKRPRATLSPIVLVTYPPNLEDGVRRNAAKHYMVENMMPEIVLSSPNSANASN